MFQTERDVEECKGMLEGDLTFIRRNLYRSEPIGTSEIAQSSVILRKWLNEGLLGRLARHSGFEPSFPAIDNHMVVDAVNAGVKINFFLTGGVKFSGRPISGVYDSDEPYQGKPMLPVLEMNRRLMKTGEFLKQPRIFHNKRWFRTSEIISFVANKLGGAHFDRDRDAATENAATYASFGGEEPIMFSKEQNIHLVLEPQGNCTLSAFHVEVLAAASSFMFVHFNGQQLAQMEGS